MGFPKEASIPFGRERGLNPARDYNLIDAKKIVGSGLHGEQNNLNETHVHTKAKVA
jgi:hypothetical protein